MIFWDLNKWQKRFVFGLWGGMILTILLIWILFFRIAHSNLPSFDELENPKYNLATVIYDTHGTPLGKYYLENREPIAFDSISPHIIDALLATEDERFYRHTGIDFKAISRVFFKTLLLGQGSSGGGSTISQQLAKLLFERPSLEGLSRPARALHLVSVKFKEWIIAVKLEKRYTKEEIMAMYLNKFEFIYGAHGIQAAAKTYFGKDQKNLGIEEASTLVGMLKNPALFNPVRFYDRALDRRNTVLNLLRRDGKISGNTLDSLSLLPIDISRFRQESHDTGPAPYFRAELTKWVKDFLLENDIKKSDNTPYNVYTDGLKIYTTIDLNYQRHAEQSVFDHMKENQKRYWNAWRGMDPINYRADNHQKELRYASIESRILNSDRYQSLKAKQLDPVLDQIEMDFDGLQLTEKAIRGMIRVSKRLDSWSNLVKEEIVRETSLTSCKALLASKSFEKLESTWKEFEKRVDDAFSQPVPMKIFAYTKAMESDTLMSPKDSILYHLRHLQAGMLVMEPGTGHIKAWVGGIGFKYFKYDHITSRRQVGSTFKPIVYATAISMMGLSPCQQYYDMQYTISPGESNFNIQEEWSPSNAEGDFTFEKYSLYRGLQQSRNSITVKLVKELGNVEVIRDLARNMGIPVDADIGNGKKLLPNVPAICLGAADISVMDMTGAYGTFANNGIYTKPVFVTRIEDKNGKVLYSHVPQQRTALNPVYNAVMVDMLKNNVGNRFAQDGIRSVVGGKTGTTNDFNDAWFMGITPHLVTGIWVGGDEKWVRFYTLNDGQGSVMARPILRNFLQGIESDTSIRLDFDQRFNIPASQQFRDLIDCRQNRHKDPETELLNETDKNLHFDEFEEEFEEGFRE